MTTEQEIKQQLSPEQLIAMQLMQTMRGQFIISQALCLALNVLSRSAGHEHDTDIEDMEKLLAMFPLYRAMQKVEDDLKSQNEEPRAEDD